MSIVSLEGGSSFAAEREMLHVAQLDARHGRSALHARVVSECVVDGLDRFHLRRSCGSWAFRRAVIVPRSQPVGLLHIRSRVLSFRAAVVGGIFFAVDRRHMRRISVAIRSPDSEFLPVCIDPFPKLVTGNPSLVPCAAFGAHDIRRKPVAIAAAEAPAMV